MTHEYSVTGIKCEGCIEKVKSALLSIPGISDVNINGEKASITMKNHIMTKDMNAVLTKAGNYSLEETASVMPHEKEKYDYYPLILIAIYLVAIVLVSQFARGKFVVSDMMSIFMAGFFLTFSFFKLLDLKGFAYAYSSYDIIAKHFLVYGYIYPFIELSLGIAYLVNFNPLITNIVTFKVMIISSIGVIQSLLQKRAVKCACLGTIFNLPTSSITLIEDALMAVMALIMIIIL
jgi:copper chaperone CopZ